METSTATNKVIENHPKYIDIWAKRFLKISRGEGRDKALYWASSFLRGNDTISKVADRVKELLKRGA